MGARHGMKLQLLLMTMDSKQEEVVNSISHKLSDYMRGIDKNNKEGFQ